jgi:2-amino-4-hydroxy-6-hydroxymethyldihydropteridine diphosphokinase
MRAHLSLGSNVGDRASHLKDALSAMGGHPHIALTAVSRIYQTAPVGKLDQPDFLNMAAEIETELTPEDLLSVLKSIEARIGRQPAERWGPRLIDIDIILYENERIQSDSLSVPHPEFRRRAFVLVPLAEIAAEAHDPETGQSVGQLAAGLADCGDVKPYEPGLKEVGRDGS